MSTMRRATRLGCITAVVFFGTAGIAALLGQVLKAWGAW